MENTIIRQRADTHANWTASNPIIPDRQLIIATDVSGVDQFFLGDGTSRYLDLTALGIAGPAGPGGTGDKGDKGDPGEKGDKGDQGDPGADGVCTCEGGSGGGSGSAPAAFTGFEARLSGPQTIQARNFTKINWNELQYDHMGGWEAAESHFVVPAAYDGAWMMFSAGIRVSSGGADMGVYASLYNNANQRQFVAHQTASMGVTASLQAVSRPIQVAAGNRLETHVFANQTETAIADIRTHMACWVVG